MSENRASHHLPLCLREVTKRNVVLKTKIEISLVFHVFQFQTGDKITTIDISSCGIVPSYSCCAQHSFEVCTKRFFIS